MTDPVWYDATELPYLVTDKTTFYVNAWVQLKSNSGEILVESAVYGRFPYSTFSSSSARQRLNTDVVNGTLVVMGWFKVLTMGDTIVTIFPLPLEPVVEPEYSFELVQWTPLVEPQIAPQPTHDVTTVMH